MLFQLGTLVSYGITQQLLMDSIVASWSSMGKFTWELVMASWTGSNSRPNGSWKLSVCCKCTQTIAKALCFCTERLK